MNIKRAKIMSVVSLAFAILGSALAPPQWIGLGVAMLCGVLHGGAFIDATKRKRNDARTLAPLPVIIGWAIWSVVTRRSSQVDEIAFGSSLQFLGIAFLFGFGIISIYLTKEARRKEE
jgi:hypothetical protein